VVVELSLPRVGKEEYQFKPSKHHECTLWLLSRRCQRRSSDSIGIGRPLDLLVIDLSSAEHSGILAQGSNIGEIHPKGLKLLLRLEL